jgi:uncharacterized 2Fe-2S/4Fe-4S cluster protein (DUF4445 family)
MAFHVDFEPIGRRIRIEPGTTLLDAAQRAGVLLTAICGGEGSCGRCIVRVMKGQVSAPTKIEQAELGRERGAEGWHLACQTSVLGDVNIHVPPDSLATAQRTQTEGQAIAVELRPAVTAFDVQVTPPALDDLRSDAVRVQEAIPVSDSHWDISVLRQLSNELRDRHFQLTALVRGKEIIGICPAQTSPLGLAVDIGTTKLAAYLVDLASGETLAALGAMNPQIAYGEDVMARINHAMSHPEGAKQLRSAIVAALNSLARDLCTQVSRQMADIADAVVVGNTAMHHLFLGLPVRQLGLAPYVAAESAALDVKAHDVGLDLAPGAYVHLLPNVAGFVGADHLAMLLATGVAERDGVVLAMDIGTNTEVSLRANGKHFACSTASGPAFEGAHIRFGMRAAPGAIERISIRQDRVYYQTVGGGPPTGLCGSGILDLVAQLRRANLINSRGAFIAEGNYGRVRRSDTGFEFVVVHGDDNGGNEITFDRKDISKIQLAKGAMRAGVNILLKRAGVSHSDIDELIIAGAFGTYLDVQSGLDIGMFPKVGRDKIRQVGNAAGAGARMALLSLEQRERARRIARRIEYVELTSEPDFQSEFARALSIG